MKKTKTSRLENYPRLARRKKNREIFEKDKCDKYDYLAAVGCGAIGGLVDVFMVGVPKDSVIGKWTDEATNKAVVSFAKLNGWKPKAGNGQNPKKAIGFLERKFKVNYDQKNAKDVGGLFDISPNSHHMMSLAHSPDILGLFFSILNQFCLTSTFVVDGKAITIDAKTKELVGGNFVSKLFCGVANWFGHLMSDVAGSGSSKGRGKGIVMPFYELFGHFKFCKFKVGKEIKDFAEIAMEAYVQGSDFRFGMAQSVPLIIAESLIRLIWGLRRRFEKKLPLKRCIPTLRHNDLKAMVLIGDGTLCVMDLIDAGARSGGVFLNFFMRLNLVAWCRLLTLVIRQVLYCANANSFESLDNNLNVIAQTNDMLDEYLSELEMIDYSKYEENIRLIDNFNYNVKIIENEESMNKMILTTFDKLGINLPWDGEFDEFMSNRDNRLSFG